MSHVIGLTTEGLNSDIAHLQSLFRALYFIFLPRIQFCISNAYDSGVLECDCLEDYHVLNIYCGIWSKMIEKFEKLVQSYQHLQTFLN